jgi:hypothetical protein
MPPVPASFALDFALFTSYLAHPDNGSFAKLGPPTPETRCPRPSPSVGMLEILAPCSDMSVLLTPKRRVLGLISGRFLTTGLSLPLAEISTAGLLVATGPLNGTQELPASC